MTRSANSAATSSTMTNSPNIGARTYLLRRRRLSLELVGFGLEGGDELVEGLAERRHPFFLQRARDVAHVDADGGQLPKDAPPLVETLVHGALEPAMVLEVVERLIGHRVHGLGADEVVDVQRVGVLGVLRRRRRP